MTRSILLLLSADPALTTRSAEGIRLAAGLVACGRIEVQIYLHGVAVKCLAPEIYDALDSDILRQFWPLAASAQNPVWIQPGMLERHSVTETEVPTRELAPDELITRIRQADTTWHFDASIGPPIFHPGQTFEASSGDGITKRALVLTMNPSVPPPPAVFDLQAAHWDYTELLHLLYRADHVASF